MPTDAEIEAAIKSVVSSQSTADQSSAQDGEQTPVSPRYNTPQALKEAEFGRHYEEETADPLGAAGERGEPVPDESQQVDPAALEKAARAAYEASKPGWQKVLEPVREFDWTFGKRLLGDVVGTAAGLSQQASAIISGATQAPNLQGLSVDQVKSTREQMVNDKAEVDKQISDLMNHAQPGSDDELYILSQKSNSFEARIKEADGIIASGQSSFVESPTTEPVGKFLRSFGEHAVPATKEKLDSIFPTEADFANSWPGQIATIGADAAYLGATSALGVGLPAAAGLFGSQQYEDAKAHGASDETAERASLMTGLTTAATMPVMGAGVNLLSKSFAGLTAREGIAAIVEAGTRITGAGGEMTMFQLQQNAIAKLSGYDPDRKMDEGTWQAFWTGIGFGAVSHAIEHSPRLARLNKPDVTVRNKAGTPPDTGPSSEPPPPTQLGTTQPAPTDASAQAQAQVAKNVGAPDEAVLANQGDPEANLLHVIRSTAQEEPETAPAAATAVAPTETAPQPTSPTPVATAEPPTEAVRPTTPSVTETPAPQESTGLANLGEMGKGISEGLRDMLWERFQKGKTTEAGGPSNLLLQAAAEKQAGRISSRADFEEFLDRYGRSLFKPTKTKAWYETEGLANRPALRPAEEIAETPVTRADIKREVNQAQQDMGMVDHLHYVPDVESLPAHVKNGLTVGERKNTAQIVRDNKLGDIYVIGDRFQGLQELRKAIIEETQPYLYRKVTDLKVRHDPTDRDLGRYDPISDSPSLNTHAILRSPDPYLEGSRTAMEEVNVHQGISKLLGPRDASTYVEAMNSIQQNFDRLKLNDILAQKKGYKNLDEMAKAYQVEDYKTNPRSQHKLTEELIGAYSRTFKNPAELAANGPPWYQQALRNLNSGIRRSLGLKLPDHDVQSLLADSAAALRRPKYGEPGQFHPETAAKAKDDMARFQLANRLPEEGAPAAGGEQPPPAEGAPAESAQIGEELIRARQRELERGLQPGEKLRQQPLRLSMQQARTFRERMNLLNENTVVDNIEHDRDVMQSAHDMYMRDFGGDPNIAMQRITEWHLTGAINPHLVEVTNRAIYDQVRDLKARGFNDQAALLEAKLDRFNMDVAPRVSEEARSLRAQRFRHMDGQTGSSEVKRDYQELQDREFSKRNNRPAKNAADKGLEEVKGVTKEAAETLRTKTKAEVKSLEERIAARAKRLAEKKPLEKGETRPRGTTKSLPEQYTEDLVKRIDVALNKVAKPSERAPLEEVYNTFRKNIQEQVKEQVDLPERPKLPQPSPTDTLKEIVTNHPYYAEAWKRTVDALQTTHPELFKALDRALAEPVGEGLAKRLSLEHGQDLNDLIYNHFSKVDRVTEDLGQKIADATGLSGAESKKLADHLQSAFKNIVEKNQQTKLNQILKSIGGIRGPSKGELGRLVDHIVLGSLDNSEWLNHVAPRFGIENYTPKEIAALKLAGDKMAKMRDDGLADSVIAQKIRRDISDLSKIDRDPAITKAMRYVNDVYASSLLTGPFTHAPYWQQSLMQGFWDSMVQGIRASVKTRNPMILAQQIGKAFHGYARGIGEFGPILRHDYAHAEEFMEKAGEKKLYSGPLQRTQFSWQNPGTWFSRFKYVRNFLDAISNLMLQGPEYAALHANAMSMHWDDGLRGQDAWQAATDVVLGTKAQQLRAKTEADNFARELGLDKGQTRILYNELLDRYKTTSDLPPGPEADVQTERLRDLARRAFDTGATGVLRGDVRGVAGHISRGLLDFANKHPGFRPVAEFLKVPFNLINEFMAWTPVGFWRSIPDLVPPVPAHFARQYLGMGGVEGYLKDVPGMKGKIERGEMSDEHMRDIAWNQLSKAVVGSSIAGILGSYIHMNLSNPNPPVRFTYMGPSSYGQQEIERGKGWRERSIYFGGAWHSYENTPLRTIFAMLGAYEDYFRYYKQNQEPVSNEVFAIGNALRGGATSLFGSPLQGLDNSLNALTQFQGTSVVRNLENFFSQSIGSAATALAGGTAVRQVYRAFVNPKQYEAPDIWAKIIRNIPVVNDMFLHPKLDVFGEPVTATPWTHFPEYGTPVPKDDPVWGYLARHPEIRLAMPGDVASVARIRMTPEELFQYHSVRGPYLKEELAHAFKDPGFKSMPADRKNLIIKEYERAAKAVGDAAVMRYRQSHPPPKEAQISAGIEATNPEE